MTQTVTGNMLNPLPKRSAALLLRVESRHRVPENLVAPARERVAHGDAEDGVGLDLNALHVGHADRGEGRPAPLVPQSLLPEDAGGCHDGLRLGRLELVRGLEAPQRVCIPFTERLVAVIPPT